MNTRINRYNKQLILLCRVKQEVHVERAADMHRGPIILFSSVSTRWFRTRLNLYDSVMIVAIALPENGTIYIDENKRISKLCLFLSTAMEGE